MNALQNAAADCPAPVIYEHTQRGGLAFCLTALITVAAAVIAYLILSNAWPIGDTLGFVLFFLVFGLAGAVLVWSLSSMTVTINGESLRIAFGLRFFTKNFALKDITGCRAVKNDFWYNWGIRLAGNGWLYNVAGFDAVEIRMKSGKQNRIGTDQPRELAEAILRAVVRPSAAGGDA